MKPEPLTKEKIRFLRIESKKENVILGTPFTYISDVKNAVEWLLKEIEKEFNIFEDSYGFEDMEDYYLENIPGESWDKFRNEIISKIKKAFEGAEE